MTEADKTADDGRSSTDAVDKTRRRFGLIAAVVLVVLALDQLSKSWALDALSSRVIPVVWTLQLNLARNTGTAFSVGRGTDWGRFVPLLALAVVAYVIWQGRSVATKTGAIAIGMIVGGAVGNLFDRALRTNGGGFFSGGVVDFIDFQWWPIFNVADSCVVVGGLLLVLVSLRAPVDEQGRGNPEVTSDPSAGDPSANDPSGS